MSAVHAAGTGPGVVVTVVLYAVVATLLAACNGPFPRDTDGSLDRITGGVLRAGVSENPPWTEVHDDGRVSGREVDLVTGFAESRDAVVEWTPGSEGELVAATVRGDLDLVVGGLTSDAPWGDEVALTRPYADVVTPDEDTEQMVMATPLGENALLVALETYLAGTGEAP